VRLFAVDEITPQPRARAWTVVEQSGLAPRRVLVRVYDSCDVGLTIDSRLLRHCSHILCAVPGIVNMLV
jgi:hypothetical protein